MYVGGNSLRYSAQLGLLPMLNERFVEFAANLGDAYSLGITKLIRKKGNFDIFDRQNLIPLTNGNVIKWICYAKSKSQFDPKGVLTDRRDNGLDINDANLSAAERYYEGYNGNYGRLQILSQHFSKHFRDIAPFKNFFPKWLSAR